jgi:hypothetical protein
MAGNRRAFFDACAAGRLADAQRVAADADASAASRKAELAKADPRVVEVLPLKLPTPEQRPNIAAAVVRYPGAGGGDSYLRPPPPYLLAAREWHAPGGHLVKGASPLYAAGGCHAAGHWRKPPSG